MPMQHLLLHVVRAAEGHITRFIKVQEHRGEPLNEAADALAAAAADLDPGRPAAIIEWILTQKQCTSCTEKHG